MAWEAVAGGGPVLRHGYGGKERGWLQPELECLFGLALATSRTAFGITHTLRQNGDINTQGKRYSAQKGPT